jgi:hypothetical protein
MGIKTEHSMQFCIRLWSAPYPVNTQGIENQKKPKIIITQPENSQVDADLLPFLPFMK